MLIVSNHFTTIFPDACYRLSSLKTHQSLDKKNLKILKEQSESVNRRRTDHTMAKEKVQKDKQRSTKHTHTTKDRVTQTQLKTEG